MSDRILLLDDESSILDVLGQLLESLGYEYDACRVPAQAIERLSEGKYSLLITDVKMPGMSGIEVVKKAKEIDPELSIVVVTAMMDVSNAIQAIRAGADDYVLKPFNLNEISISVKKALDKRGLLVENRSYQEQLEARVRSATEDLERINAELRETKEYLENLLHSTVDAIITTDLAGNITFVNDGALTMLGYTREELVGQNVSILYVGGAEEVQYSMRLLGEGNPLKNFETTFRHKSGFDFPVNISLSYVKDADGKVRSILAICKDITNQKQLEQELKEISIKDSLTGLYNQRYFHDRLAAEVERARRQKHPLSLLLFDVDQFKTYNDCHGHLAGDKVLQTVGKVVLECTRDHVDIGFRYGGDEFVVILPEAEENQALIIAERIRKSFEAHRFDHLTLSIGLMSYREGYSLRNFIQFTDSMMYDAKRSGGNRTYVYKPEQQAKQMAPAAEGRTEE